jgi:hypothetical protein
MTSSATPTDAAPAAPEPAKADVEVDAAAPPAEAAPPAAAPAAPALDEPDDQPEDDEADDGEPERAPAPSAPGLWLVQVQAVVLFVLSLVSLALNGLDPPPPGEVALVALPAFAVGHVFAYVLRDYRVARADGVLMSSRHLPRLVAAIAVLIGWCFIGWHERFRITPPTAFLCLGWLAVVEAVLFLWRTGFVAAEDLDDADVRWWRPRGERDELEREKRSLLKAIKEIEFDREMGKTTEQDAGQIVRMYRARAIDVIKALDELDGAGATTVREEIDREVRARVQLAGKRGKKKKGQKAEDAS